MAKHFYHIPLQNALAFIKTHKSTLNTTLRDKKALEYYKQLGRSYYTLQIESFIEFFKIDRDLEYALKTLEYFHSSVFMAELHKVLNLSQFGLDTHRVETRELFYTLCYLYAHHDAEAFELFVQKTLLHYHTAFNAKSNISVDHKEISQAIAKSKRIAISESFGEEGDESFFKLLLDNSLVVEERGKRIKTLRKRAYRKLMYQLLDI